VLHTKFQLIWPNGLREFFLIHHNKQELPMEVISFLQSYNSLCVLVPEEKIFFISDNQKKELLMEIS
jgi:hypothetical protein